MGLYEFMFGGEEASEETETMFGFTAEGATQEAEKLAVDIPEITWKDVGNVALDFTPIIGDIKGGYETVQMIGEELSQENPNYYLIGAMGGLGAAATIIGLVPGAGDAAAAAIRSGARSMSASAGKAAGEVVGSTRAILDGDMDFLMGRGNPADSQAVGAQVSANTDSLWSIPEQTFSSADTSINSSKLPKGYSKLKNMNVFEEGQVVVDIGGGRFDNAVEDLATQGVDLNVYDPFNRSPEHNASVAAKVSDGGADVAVSNNVLNVIQEPENIDRVIAQASNSIKSGDKAYFTVYVGDKTGVGKQTSKGWQNNKPTAEYVEQVEGIFGRGNVERRGDVIIATKTTNSVPATVSQQTEDMLDLDRRVDTRLPTSNKSPDFERIGEGELVSDGDAMFSANKNMSENFAMMADNYPGMKNLWSDDVAETRANVTEQMTGNIVSLYDMSDRLGIADESKQWYRGANRIALGLSSRFGVPDTKSAGVLAALSPQKNWFENVALAERIIKHHTELGPNAPWSQAMDDITTTVPPARKKQGNTSFQDGKNNAILESIKGKPWGELETPEQKGMWIRAYDEAHFGREFREVSPEGDILGYYAKNDGTPSLASHQGFGTLAKVVRILEGDGTLNSISPELGKEHKVRNFFNNILNPDSFKDITVDTHQIAAGLFRPLGSGSVEVGQGLSGSNKVGNPAVFSSDGKATSGMGGTYGLYFDATAEGAKLRGVLPREMQSVSWEQLRTLFPDTLKRDKSFISATEAIWRMVDDKQLNPEGARNLIIAEAEKRGQTEDRLIPSWKKYSGKRRDIGIATTGLIGAAGLATAEEAPTEEEGFASKPN